MLTHYYQCLFHIFWSSYWLDKGLILLCLLDELTSILWWNAPSLSLLIFFIWKSTFSDKDIDISAFFQLIFAWYIFLYSLSFSTMLNQNDVSRYSCLIVILGKNFQSFTIKYDISRRLFVDVLYQVEKIFLYAEL